MKQNNSENKGDLSKFIGVIFLALLWMILVGILFARGGVNLKNIIVAGFSGIIIIYPLWKKYIQPYLDQHKKQ